MEYVPSFTDNSVQWGLAGSKNPLASLLVVLPQGMAALYCTLLGLNHRGWVRE